MISMFQSWLTSVGNAPLEGQNILQQVRDFIERYSDSRFSSKEGYPSNRFINERAGWWDESPTGGKYICSLRQDFVRPREAMILSVLLRH